MEDIKKKIDVLCEVVAANGGNVIIIGDVEGTGFQTVICKIHGGKRELAMDIARIVHRKDSKTMRSILKMAGKMLEITKQVTEEQAADA